MLNFVLIECYLFIDQIFYKESSYRSLIILIFCKYEELKKKKSNIDQKFTFFKLKLVTQYIIKINFLYIKTHYGYYA